MGEAQADVWPTKNVWAIVKEKVKESEPVYKEALRKVIIKCWREINADKADVFNSQEATGSHL